MSTVKIVCHNTFQDRTPPSNHRELIGYSPSTIVIDEFPDYQTLRQRIGASFLADPTVAEIIEFKLGVAITHPKDQFSRKEGLRLATEKLTPTLVYVDSVILNAKGDVKLITSHPSGAMIVIELGTTGRTFLGASNVEDLYRFLYKKGV